MQALVVLSTVLALLAGYLEWWAPSPHTGSPAVAHVVIRSTQAAPSAAGTSTLRQQQSVAHTVTRIDKPLNLALPATDDSPASLILEAGGRSLNDLFEGRTERERVTYNAELVFDRETGEDITGGKLNIKIPLS